MGFVNGPNVYTYALNSPQMYTDPDGRVVWFAPILAGAAIGGGLDLAFQLYREDGDFGCVNWASVTEFAELGALGGGVGVGLVRSSGRLFYSGGLLNSNRYLRIGFGRRGVDDREVFRASGKIVERVAGRKHLDFKDAGPWTGRRRYCLKNR